MPKIETIDERLRAVERALTGDDHDLTELETAAEITGSIDSLDDRLESVETRLDDLDAAVQAIRGYVGNIRAVNREVERRADAALAAVESFEDVHAPDVQPIYPRPERPPSDECGEVEAVPDAQGERARVGLISRVREVL